MAIAGIIKNQDLAHTLSLSCSLLGKDNVRGAITARLRGKGALP
jgi:hypothetical protein